MKKALGITLAALALASIGWAQDVHHNYDSEANFASFKTYKMVEIPGGVKVDELIARQLTTSLEAALKAKGLTKVDTDTADVYVGLQAAVTQEKQIDMYSSGFGRGPRWGGGMATATTSTLLIGSVSVDIYELGSKHLVWRGVATKTVDAKAKPEKRQKNIDKGFAKLFKNYPPKKK